MKTLFIVNPRAGAGRAGKQWERNEHFVRKHFETGYDVRYTEYPEHATSLTRIALQNGYERIVSVGGDGTLNEVLNGFIENNVPVNDRAVLGMIEFGTGSDFKRTILMPEQFEKALLFLKEKPYSSIDIGKATFHTFEGKQQTRFFINITDFGIGGAVAERVNRTTKYFGGYLSFLSSIVITLLTYNNKTIKYRFDSDEWQTGVFNNFIIANGRYFGSGLLPAPNAELNDGYFDVVLFGNIGTANAIRNLSSLRKGTHITHPLVRTLRVKKIEAYSKERVAIDMDGEMVGYIPITAEILPNAVSFIM